MAENIKMICSQCESREVLADAYAHRSDGRSSKRSRRGRAARPLAKIFSEMFLLPPSFHQRQSWKQQQLDFGKTI